MRENSAPDCPGVRIKVCGVTCAEDARGLRLLGIDWVGLNFHPPSPRWVDPQRARLIVAELAGGPRAVGVFVNRSIDEVRSLAASAGIDMVQLHGDETPEFAAALIEAGFRVIRAYRVRDEAGVRWIGQDLDRLQELGVALEGVLIDAAPAPGGNAPVSYGGTGQVIAEDVLRQLRPGAGARLPIGPRERLILAGGLTPENVAERIRLVRPWMVDVASGVERSPGRKDLSRVRAFQEAVRQASLSDGA